MNQQLNDLHLRRGRLLERIAYQRAALSEQVEPLHSAFDRTDQFLGRVYAVVYYLKTHPVGAAALALVTVYLVKPRRAWRWSARAFSVWQTWRLMRERMQNP